MLTPAAEAGHVQGRTFDDPVPYCRAVGTIDHPDRRYIGPRLPGWMARRLGVDPARADWVAWRCAKGTVMACVYGANLACGSKARTGRRPDEAIRAYCHTHPDADFVPMIVTGHDSAVSWRCRGRRAQAWRVDPVDAQGYLKRIWSPVAP